MDLKFLEKIGFIQKIKAFFENRKLKRLPDEILVEKVEEKIEKEEISSIPKIIEHVGDNKTKLDMVKNLVESENLSTEQKKDVINTLPHATKKQLFKESWKSKEVLAKKDLNAFLEIITTDKRLKPYDELYYRVDKAFSDSELARMMETIAQKRPESYDAEKILRITAKQMVVNVQKNGVFLASHLDGLTRNIIIDEEKDGKQEKREFSILREDDRELLISALEEEADILKEKRKMEKEPIIERGKTDPESLRKLVDDIAASIQHGIDRANQRDQKGKSR